MEFEGGVFTGAGFVEKATSPIARRLSGAELTEQILEMAKTGVYRESVFEALRPVATKRQIREAIAQSKQFGVHSVASLRDEALGTYYQLDLVKYRSLQSKIHTPAAQLEPGELLRQYELITHRMNLVLGIAQAVAIALFVTGIGCVFGGQTQLSFGLLSSATGVALVWGMQRLIFVNRNHET